MKYIKIFLASSINSFKTERLELEAYTNRLNHIYTRKGIYFDLIVCEGLSNQLELERKQDMYNKEIRESQFFYVLLGEELGQFTAEEFDVALTQFRAQGEPRIYTFFQKLPDEAQADSVKAFMRRLDQELGHYYSVFDHIDSVKLNMLLELARSSQLDVEVGFQDGQALVEGQEVLSLANIPVYAKNEDLKRWRMELEEVRTRLSELAAAYARDPGDSEVRNSLTEASIRCKELTEAIAKTEEQMLRLCSMIAEANGDGRPMTWREKEAGRLLEAGDYEGALAVLRLAEYDRDAERLKKQQDRRRQEAAALVNEARLRIQTLSVKSSDAETRAEIEECYRAAVMLAEEFRVELEVLYEYGSFLQRDMRVFEALQMLDRLNHYYELDPPTVDKRCFLALRQGEAYNMLPDYEKAEEAYLSVLDLIKNCGREETSNWARETEAEARNALAEVCMLKGDGEEAETFFKQAQEILGDFKDPADIKKRLLHAQNYASFGVYLSNSGEYGKADEYFLLAIEMYRQIRKDWPDHSFETDERICAITNNRAQMLVRMGRDREAEPLFRQCLQMYQQMEQMDAVLELQEAQVMHSLALVLAQKRQYTEVCKLYRKAEAVFWKLFQDQPDLYEPDLADIEYGLAEAFRKQRRYKEAEPEYKKALGIYRRLAEEEPQLYEPVALMIWMELSKIALLEHSDTVRFRQYAEEAMRICEKYPDMAEQAQALKEVLCNMKK